MTKHQAAAMRSRIMFIEWGRRSESDDYQNTGFLIAATTAIMMVAWWATSYGIEGTFAFLSAMWVAAYIYIEIRHRGIKERNLIRRKRL
ncbi:MAG: hypothetical protein IIB59_02515 [Planctomycetes bacterium]|nr:hypothetical protein [Planctomycetota bacterium]